MPGCEVNDIPLEISYKAPQKTPTKAPQQSHKPFDATGQVTFDPCGHILTNVGCWSSDSQWLVYDLRVDETIFDGPRIERVNVRNGNVQVLYKATDGSHCGVVTCSPTDDRVVFIHGPENPTPDWSYAAEHRRGTIVHAYQPGRGLTMDARDITEPFTPGALRGGTHVHTFSGDGQWVSFTYEDHVLKALGDGDDHEINQRNVGISVPGAAVTVDKDNPRNHDGSHFTVLATRTVNHPQPGSDQISKAFEDSWIGTDGYITPGNRHQKRAIAFQGNVVAQSGETISEVFVVDLPDDVTIPSDDGPLQGTAITRPRPPKGTVQRRLTFTADRKYPGLQGPRHWLRSSPDGTRIGFLMKDDAGIVQLWTISPNGGQPVQVTNNEQSIASCFSWSPDGASISYICDNSVFVTRVADGQTQRLTPRTDDATAPMSMACVFSPDGKMIAYMRPVPRTDGRTFAQLFVVDVP
ncbi:MAG: DUF3748 domain-containing protein [Phycisphaeraceae bacterium]|nr:DUF3748 domain-containing protein [Phycisphaeraceae bacterium]